MNRLAALSESTGSTRKISPESIEDAVMRAWFEAQRPSSSQNTFNSGTDWNEIERHVCRLQRQLANAVEHGNRKAIRHYKWLIRSSQHAKMLAIRTVTQENNGRRTPGVDGKLYTSSEARNELLALVNLREKPLPVRRVYIKKKNGKQRPLGIPTIHGRVCQEIHKMAMEPEWDMRLGQNSYGFRPCRSTWDAIEQLFGVLATSRAPQWVIEGDIKGFFDNVDHEKLLMKLGSEDRTFIRRILKAPVIEPKSGRVPSLRGTPQGGIISPLLANIALNGMEEELREQAFKMGFGPQRKKPGINMVVYADDFVITCKTKEQAEQFVPVVSKWLEEHVGVELSLEKTKITHIEEGFDFLGFNVRKYNGKLLIKPSKESQLSILRKVKQLLDSNKTAKVETIIRKLNPLLRGWANYYSTVVSTDAFSYCDYRVHEMIWRWVRRRHPNKSAKWMKAKYFTRRGNRDWVLTDGSWDLFHMTNVQIVRHTKIQGNRSPFRPSDSNYFENRRKQLLLKHLNGFQKKIVEKTDGKCGLCGRSISEEHFRKWRLNNENKICFHRMIPHQLGGHTTIKNVFVTHRWCHELHYKKNGYDTMPDRPERFLCDRETVIDERVVWTGGSTASTTKLGTLQDGLSRMR